MGVEWAGRVGGQANDIEKVRLPGSGIQRPPDPENSLATRGSAGWYAGNRNCAYLHQCQDDCQKNAG